MQKKLKEWFVGFCDAEGNFQVTLKNKLKVGYAFNLSLHIRELPIELVKLTFD